MSLPSSPSISPDFTSALAYWHRLGWLSFGGPAGQIAMMHTDLVERRRWVDESSFAHGLNYCMLLPGPEAMQLACYIGWRLHGVRGGLAAGTLFVLPGAAVLLLLSWLYLSFGQVPAVAGVLLGLKAAVLGIVAFAVLRLGRRLLRSAFALVLASAALVALGGFGLPFPVVVLAAAAAGVAAGRWRPRWLPKHAHAVEAPTQPARMQASPRRALVLALGLLLAWCLPILGLLAWLGPESTAGRMGLFFSAAALVTFGGAYAVLPFVAQHAVEVQGWLEPGQMLVGLGLAETTPGPLILVLQFVGFVGGWQHPDLTSPLAAALLCAGVTLWATFLPSFLFVLPAAPWIERLREWPKASAALGGITIAVVGVMANLAIWFGWHLLRDAEPWAAVFVALLALASFVLLLRESLPLPLLVGLAGLLGWLADGVGLV